MKPAATKSSNWQLLYVRKAKLEANARDRGQWMDVVTKDENKNISYVHTSFSIHTTISEIEKREDGEEKCERFSFNFDANFRCILWSRMALSELRSDLRLIHFALYALVTMANVQHILNVCRSTWLFIRWNVMLLFGWLLFPLRRIQPKQSDICSLVYHVFIDEFRQTFGDYCKCCNCSFVSSKLYSLDNQCQTHSDYEINEYKYRNQIKIS